MRCLLLTWTSLAFLVLSATGQDSQEPFVLRIDTELVVRTVSVRDQDGRSIDDLAPEQFQVTENGILQTISVFDFQAIDETPVGAMTGGTVAWQDEGPLQLRDTTLAETGFYDEKRFDDRRLMVFYFDWVGMSQPERTRTIEAAQEFLAVHMTVADLVTILTYSGETIRRIQDFTDDRIQLMASLQGLRDGEALDGGAVIPAAVRSRDNFDIFAAERRLAALEMAAGVLGMRREAKSLIYFSNGVNLDVGNQAQLRATINAAARANVSIFPIDSRGLTAFAPLGNASQSSPGGIAAYTASTAVGRMHAFQRSQDALYTLAADTDGIAFLDSNDLTAGIVKAQRATSGYYILGYYSTDTRQDGRSRHVKIELVDRSGNISYQDTYYAKKDLSQYTIVDKERQLEEALLLGDPITDLPIAAESNHFRVNETMYFVPVAVRIPGSELISAHEAGADKARIDFVGEIRNDSGRIITRLRDEIQIRLTGNTEALFASNPVQYDTGFSLRAGRYTLKLVARNADTGRMGTYQTSLVVPDLAAAVAQLPISSVVLSSRRIHMKEAFNADEVPSADAQTLNPLVRDEHKLIPNVGHVFSRTEPLYVYLEAYSQTVSSEALAAIVTLYDGQEKIFETPVFRVHASDEDSHVVPVALTVNLATLSPGEYTFQVTILNPEERKFATWQRQVLIVP